MSMIYLKKAGGTIKVHGKDEVDNIVVDSSSDDTSMKFKKSLRYSKKKNRVFSALDSTSTVSVSCKSQTNQSERSQNWLNKNAIKELQNSTNNEYHATKQLYSPFLKAEKTIMKEVEDFLAHKELTDLRKKELLHKRWTEQVYEPIRKKIINALNESDWQSLDCHKREMHRQFLEHVNKRGFIFLRDDEKGEYYVPDHHPASLKVKTKALCDPLHVERRQRTEEDSTILRCMTGHRYTERDLEQVRLPPLPLIPLGRHGVNSCRWLEMPRHNIDNLSRSRDKSRIVVDNGRATINFRTWAQEGYNAKLAAEELQIPHKRMFTEHPPYGRPPVPVSHVPFIDQEEFADKIVNTNPFPQHLENLKAETEEVREFLQNQQYFKELEMEQLLSQENKHQSTSDQNHQQQLLENSQQQQLMENSEQQQLMDNSQQQQLMENSQQQQPMRATEPPLQQTPTQKACIQTLQ